MLRDLSNQKKVEPEVVLAAIKSLQDKGWDINPYTVADEAKIPRSTLYRSSELMDLVSQARGEIASGDQTDASVAASAGPAAGAAILSDEGDRRIIELEVQIAELQNEVES